MSIQQLLDYAISSFTLFALQERWQSVEIKFKILPSLQGSRHFVATSGATVHAVRPLKYMHQ